MVAPTRAEQLAKLSTLARAFHETIPHNLALGLELIEFGDGLAVMRLPYRTDLIGDPNSGVLHGGAISSLLDATFGLAAFMALTEPTRIATLDLRIDYLKPATPGMAVHAKAECYRRTRTIAFVRGFAYHDDEASPIAAGSATFMISAGPPPMGTRPKSSAGSTP